MGRRRSCKNEINKGTWTKEEDEILFTYVTLHGERKWREVAQFSGLKRCAKSCRYRYLNYLKPGLKRGDISEDEQDLIIELQHQLGNRWALIAKRLPGRTDIEIKNYWKIYLSKKLNHQQHKPNININMIGSSSDHSTTSLNTSSSNIQTEEDDEDDNNIDDFLLIDQIGNNNNNNVNDDKKKVEDDEKLINRHGLKGAWSKKEDEILSNYVALHGEGQWNKVAQRTGLKRCGKSCRHRFLHYLKPGIKRGNISEDEEKMIIRLHNLHGNRWTLIAKMLPGRTDSEIKNHWHAYLSKKLDDEDAKSSLNKDYDHQKSEDNHIDEEQMKYVFTPQVDDLPAKRSNLEDNNNINNIWEFSELDFDLNYTTDPTTNNSSLFEIEYDTAFLDSYLFNFFQNDQMNADVHHHELISKTPKFDEDHKDVFASSFNIVHGHCEAEEADIMDFWTSSDEFRFTDW